MTNHYHILIKPMKDPLSKIMGLINKRYSDSYAKRYNHIGRIYQKRYFAKEVDMRLGLLAVSSYIHRNPIDTKQPMVEQLEWYPYSSYPYYFDETKPPPLFLDTEILKELLLPTMEKTNVPIFSIV
ncbi:transposase [Psychrobacillus sp. NPDC093180]|uniref:transposase n=1 Tax=Psychrobacillus sp. NPDC093180 TaxID=3364489 RepID=UPI0037FFB4D0